MLQQKQLTNLKHDMTTPINGIIGYSELLLEEIEFEETIDTQLTEDLEKLKSLGYDLLSLIKQNFPFNHSKKDLLELEEATFNIIDQLCYKLQIPLTQAREIIEKLLLNSTSQTQSDLQKIKESIETLWSLLEDIIARNFEQKVESCNRRKPIIKRKKTESNFKKQLNVTHSNSNILIIDDNKNNQDILSRNLKNEGYEVSIASNGYQGIDMISSHDYDIILLDMLMPDINGYEVLKWIKNSQWRNIPVIMVSSVDELDSVVKCIEKGAEDYIHKPFNAVLLKTKVNAFLEKKHLRDQEQIYLKKIAQTNQELLDKNELIRQIFGRYLSNAVVNELLESPKNLQLGGERRNITMLTSDLRGFTSLAESLSPEKVIKILNTYFLYMTNIIEKHKGTIDEFMGDGILILFGAPIQREDDEIRAIACALEMQLAMTKVNEEMKKIGIPPLEMGIGINTGDVVVGNIGSEKRTKYGVVGSHVNLTYRIESYTIGGQILISESTWEKTQSIVKISQSELIYPKGIKKPFTIYTVIGIEGEYNLELKNKKDIFVNPDPSIKLKYSSLDGKHINKNVFQGSLIQLSLKKALIVSHQESLNDLPSNLSNIKINLLDTISEKYTEDIYAKVLSVDPEKKQFLVHFTFQPAQIKSKLKEVYNSS